MPHGKITQFLSKYCCCCTTGELDIDESKRPIARANGASNIRGQKNTRTSSRVDSTSQITSERKTTHLITETSVVSTPRTNTSGVETNASNTNVSYNKNATSASSNLQETMYGYNNRYDTSSNQNVQKETTTGTNSTSNTNVSSSTAQTAREANETARRTYYTDTSNRNNSQYESSIRTTTTSITRTSTLAPHGNNVSNNTTQNSTSTNSSRFQDTYRSTAANFNKLDLLTKLRHSSELIRPQSQTSVNSNSTSNAAPSNGIVLPVTFQKTADTTVQNQLPSMSNSEVTSTSTTTTIELPIAVITRHDNNSTQTAFVVASNEEKDVQPNDLALVQAHSERKDDDTSPTDNKHIFTQISEELSSSVLDDTTSLASNSVMEMSSLYDAEELNSQMSQSSAMQSNATQTTGSSDTNGVKKRSQIPVALTRTKQASSTQKPVANKQSRIPVAIEKTATGVVNVSIPSAKQTNAQTTYAFAVSAFANRTLSSDSSSPTSSSTAYVVPDGKQVYMANPKVKEANARIQKELQSIKGLGEKRLKELSKRLAKLADTPEEVNVEIWDAEKEKNVLIAIRSLQDLRALDGQTVHNHLPGFSEQSARYQVIDRQAQEFSPPIEGDVVPVIQATISKK